MSPINVASIAFHTQMGFKIERGEGERVDVKYEPDHDGPGEHLVRFVHQV